MTEIVYRIGLENGAEGRSQAWALEHPGCFAYGPDGDAALAAIPQAIRDYGDWIAGHSSERWLPAGPFEVELADTWQVYSIDESFQRVGEGYEVNAWFLDDWRPLAADEVTRGLELLEWSREDLLAAVAGLSDEALDLRLPDQRWSMRGVLGHVGGAEWWYLNRLGVAFPRALVPQDPFERLRVVRVHLNDVLPELIGSRQVVGIDGEFWSPRKLLRRAAWHERDHTGHIWQLRGASGF